MAAVASTGLQLVGEQPDASGGDASFSGDMLREASSTLPAEAANRGSSQEPTGCQAEGCSEPPEPKRVPGGARLCAEHIKANSFLVAGVPSRYCTECVRIHRLEFFDGLKRSCRSRLLRRKRRRQAAAAGVSPDNSAQQASAGEKALSAARRRRTAPVAQCRRPVQSNSSTGVFPESPSQQQSPLHFRAELDTDLCEQVQPLLAPPPMQVECGPGRSGHSQQPRPPAVLPVNVCNANDTFRLFPSVTNLAMKMLNITPANLMGCNLREHLDFLLEVIPPDVQGALRPGCVFISVDLWHSNAEDARATREGLGSKFLSISRGNADAFRPFWTIADTDVYLPGSQHQVRDGRVQHSSARTEVCTIVTAEPVACNPGMEEWRVVVTSSPLHDSTCRRLMCRVRGQYYDLEVISQQHQPDGSICYTLLPPMADDALGLAWVEVVDMTSDGFEVMSIPMPMLLTTRSDICNEVSSLFDGFSPQQRRDGAGVLKDLADVLHPNDDDDHALLVPSRCAPLALLCISHALHHTLEELADEAVFRGPPNALASLAQAAESLSEGLCTCGKMCGDSPTQAAARNFLSQSMPHECVMESTAAAYCKRKEEVGTVGVRDNSEQIEGGSQPDALWGLSLVAQLERPAGAAITLAISALLSCALSSHRVQVAYHVIFLTIVLHLYFPWLYRVAYSARTLEVQALAEQLGLQAELCTKRLAFRQGVLAERYTAHATTQCLHGLPLQAAFLLGRLFMPPFLRGWMTTSLLTLLCIRLSVFLLQRAARLRPALCIWVLRLLAGSALVMGKFWLIQEGFGSSTAGPHLIIQAGASSLMAAALAAVAPPPLSEVVVLHAAAALLVIAIVQDAPDPITYVCQELPAALTYFAARVWLESMMLKSFLRHLLSTSKVE